MAKRKAKRRILKAKISFISLCPMGMNNIQTVFKADDGTEQNITIATLIKGEMSEQGELLAVVYAPETVDAEGDIASAAVIKEFAYDFAANGGGIDIRHDGQALDPEDAFIAESFIIQKDDPRFVDTVDYEDEPVDVTGGWGVVFKIDKEELREQYRSGEWGGISMGGLMAAKDITTKTNSLEKLFRKVLNKCNFQNPQSENTMLSKEDEKKVAGIVVATLKTAKEADVKEAKEKAAEVAKEKDKTKLGLGLTKPVLKSDATTKELDIHRRKLEIFELSKKVDPNDSRAIFAYEQTAKEIATCDDLNATLNKQALDPYEDFFSTNQSADSGTNTNPLKKSDSEDPIGDIILSDMAKEKVGRKNVKLAS